MKMTASITRIGRSELWGGKVDIFDGEGETSTHITYTSKNYNTLFEAADWAKAKAKRVTGLKEIELDVEYDFQLNWVVIDNEANPPRPLRWFATHDLAAQWIGEQPDKEKVNRGGYGLDGPSEYLWGE